jgi:hypothetical protein
VGRRALKGRAEAVHSGIAFSPAMEVGAPRRIEPLALPTKKSAVVFDGRDSSEEIEADDPIALDRMVEEWSLRTKLAGASRGNPMAVSQDFADYAARHGFHVRRTYTARPILSVRCRANEAFVVKRQASL